MVLAQKAGGERAGPSVGAEIQEESCRFRSWISAAGSWRASSTPVGTVLSWSDGGVSYTLAGSVRAAELREAARGLLAR